MEPKNYERGSLILKEELALSMKNLMKVIYRTEQHQFFDGSWSDPFKWFVLERGDAVSVIIHDAQRDEIILVEQFRGAVMDYLFELVAGMKPDGEDPEECVRREVTEEVGLEVTDLIKIADFYVSPGGTSEKIHLYYAEVHPLGEDGLIGGLKEENEDIKKTVISTNSALEMIDNGKIKDAKTIIALQWLKSKRKTA